MISSHRPDGIMRRRRGGSDRLQVKVSGIGVRVTLSTPGDGEATHRATTHTYSPAEALHAADCIRSAALRALAEIPETER